MRMDAISYQTPLNTVSESSDVRQTRDPVTKVVTTTRTPAFSPTGCEDVPFDLDVTTTPDTTQAGAPTGMSVALEYPEYANDPIWQAQLKDADVTLPEGVTLGPAGGDGLEQCTDAQFGRGSNDPVTCPPGSQIGDVTVESPALPTAINGKAFFGPVSGPGRPTESNPWKLFLLLEGHGLRIKLPPGEVTVAPNGQIRTVFRNNPEVPFTRFVLHTRGGPNRHLDQPTRLRRALRPVDRSPVTTARRSPTPTASTSPAARSRSPSSRRSRTPRRCRSRPARTRSRTC